MENWTARLNSKCSRPTLDGADLGTLISQAFRIRRVPETYIIAKDGVLAHAQI